MDELLKTLPLKKENATLNNSDISLHIDQGYGKVKYVVVADSCRYNMSKFAASWGSNYPFIPLLELKSKKKEWETKMDNKQYK